MRATGNSQRAPRRRCGCALFSEVCPTAPPLKGSSWPLEALLVTIFPVYVACTMSAVQVDMVLVGAEAVVESGGVVNRTGTFQIGIVCKVKPPAPFRSASSGR